MPGAPSHLSCPCVASQLARQDTGGCLSRPGASASLPRQLPQVDEVLVADRIAGVPEYLQHAHAHGCAPLRRLGLECDHHLFRQQELAPRLQ